MFLHVGWCMQFLLAIFVAMNVRLLILLVLTLILTACGSNKKAVNDDVYDKQRVEEATIKPSTKGERSLRKSLVAEAMKWKGVRYKMGGESRNGVDCSGLVMKVYEKVAGYKLPRNSAAQQIHVKQIKKSSLDLGDLVFFSINSKRVNHVGIYVGEGKIIHASGSRGVVVDDLNSKYFIKHYHSSGCVSAVLSDTLLDDIINQKLDSIYGD